MISLSIAAFLVCAVLGWKVLAWAQETKGTVKTAGQWIGWVILVVSFVGVVSLGACSLWCAKGGFGKASCGWSAGCPAKAGSGSE